MGVYPTGSFCLQEKHFGLLKAMKKIGFIDNYLDEWHANNYPGMIKALAGDEMEATGRLVVEFMSPDDAVM